MRRNLGVVGLLLGALVSPGLAHASASDVVTMSGHSLAINDEPRIFTPSNSTFSVEGNRRYLYLKITDRRTPWESPFHITIATHARELIPGIHELRTASEERAPLFSVGGRGYSCETHEGRFEIKDIGFDENDVPNKLWMVFNQSCGEETSGMFGEVRIGLPPQPAPITIAPSVMRWHAFEVGDPGTWSLAPAEVSSEDGAHLGNVRISGRDPAQFAIDDDACSGRVLAPGGTCQVWMHVVPDRAGTQWAQLRIPVEGGETRVVDLQAFVFGGTTRLALRSDPGDSVGRGVTRLFTPANAFISGSSSPFPDFGTFFYVRDRTSDEEWDPWFQPPGDEALTEGRTYHSGTGDGSMHVNTFAHDCTGATGPFTVRNLRFDANNDVRSLAIDFEQYCNSDTDALRGTFEFRLGDDTPLAPWMVPPPGAYAPPVDMGPSPVEGEDVIPPVETGEDDPPTGEHPVAPNGDPVVQNGNAVVQSDPSPSTPATRCSLSAARAGSALRGSARADRLVGTRGADVLVARSGSDTLWGRAGADCLFGGLGNDVLIGGRGTDVFRCGPGRRDVARGVQPGERTLGCELVRRAPR
jgi:hemolysin type calcium-binding protein